MTLIFTNPLFTMIFAAVFLGHRLTIIKNLSALVLMVGIILVTKPPFLFPETESNDNVTSEIRQCLDENFMLHDIKLLNWTHFQYISDNGDSDSGDSDSGDLYFVGKI